MLLDNASHLLVHYGSTRGIEDAWMKFQHRNKAGKRQKPARDHQSYSRSRFEEVKAISSRIYSSNIPDSSEPKDLCRFSERWEQ